MQRIQHLFVAIGCALILGLFASCGSTASMSSGLSDEAYILVVSNRLYRGERVAVLVDDAPAVYVRAVSEAKRTHKASRVVIRSGKHRVAILAPSRQELYNQQIFVSSRASKLITLP